MRNVSTALVLLALASLVGCASPKTVAKTPEAHVNVSMDDATARALLADDDLVAVGITTLTGADFYVTVPTKQAEPVPEAAAQVTVTWGVSPSDDSGIPDTRE